MCAHKQLCFCLEIQVLYIVRLKFLVKSDEVIYVKGTVLVSLPPNGQEIVVR